MKRQVIPNSHRLMYGVIAGDMIGKPYERRKDSIYTTDFPLFEKRSKYTDDTILTVSIMDWLMSDASLSWDVLDRSVAQWTTNGKETAQQALMSFLCTDNFEDAIRYAVSLGTDY